MIKNTIEQIIFKWKIPWFKMIKKIILFSSLFALLIIPFPEYFKDFWEYWRWALITIVFSRPLADILPKLKILKKIVQSRKEIGIFCWSFILAHWVWFFLVNEYPLFSSILNPRFRDFSNFFWWWMAGGLIAIPLLLTSNNYSIKFFWKYWKAIQRLTYLFFIFWAIHIRMSNWEYWPIILVIIFLILHILSFKKIKLWSWKK